MDLAHTAETIEAIAGPVIAISLLAAAALTWATPHPAQDSPLQRRARVDSTSDLVLIAEAAPIALSVVTSLLTPLMTDPPAETLSFSAGLREFKHDMITLFFELTPIIGSAAGALISLGVLTYSAWRYLQGGAQRQPDAPVTC